MGHWFHRSIPFSVPLAQQVEDNNFSKFGYRDIGPPGAGPYSRMMIFMNMSSLNHIMNSPQRTACFAKGMHSCALSTLKKLFWSYYISNTEVPGSGQSCKQELSDKTQANGRTNERTLPKSSFRPALNEPLQNNKVILLIYRFLKQLDLLLLNKGIKCEFWHFFAP